MKYFFKKEVDTQLSTYLFDLIDNCYTFYFYVLGLNGAKLELIECWLNIFFELDIMIQLLVWQNILKLRIWPISIYSWSQKMSKKHFQQKASPTWPVNDYFHYFGLVFFNISIYALNKNENSAIKFIAMFFLKKKVDLRLHLEIKNNFVFNLNRCS